MKVKIVAYLLVALFVIGAVEFGSQIINTLLAKKYGRVDLEHTAVMPAAWVPHKLNITYGEGGPPESVKHNHTHNAQGFKYPRDVTLEKPPKTVRIFAMGGSTLYGWGSEGLPQYGNHLMLANDETITYFLEKKLNEAVKKMHPDWNVEVINAAVIDYNSAFHLVYYNQTLWPYHADMIIFLDGNNEFYGIKPFNSFAEYRNTGVNVINSFNNRDGYFSLYVPARYLAQYSKFFKTLQYNIMNKWIENEAPTVNKIYELPASFDNFDRDYDAKAHDFLRTYAQIKAALDFDKIQMIFFLGPQMLYEDPKNLGEKDLATRAQVLKDWGSPAGLVDRGEFMQRIRRKLPAYFKSIGVTYIDDTSYVSSPATKDKALFIDYTHLTADGSQVVADEMFNPIYQRVKAIIAAGR